jgi:solute carrier family 25 folate transporter 32
MAPKRKLAPVEHMIAGTTAGLVSTAALFPLDTIKVRYQVDEKTTLKAPQRLAHAFKRVVASEGVLGLYQGLPAGLYGSGLSWGGYFYFYEAAKTRWVDGRATGERWNDAWHQAAAAVEAGTIMVALTNPIWLVKTRMQLQLRQTTAGAAAEASPAAVAAAGAPSLGGGGGSGGGGAAHRPYRSFADALTTIVKEEGPLALYKGSLPALLLVSHGAAQFVVYEALKAEAASRKWSLGTAGVLAMGAASKIVASVATYPFQVRGQGGLGKWA